MLRAGGKTTVTFAVGGTRQKVPVRTKAKLKAAIAEYLETLEGSPERVKSYFQDPSLQLLTSAKLRIGVVVGVVGIFGGDES